MKVCFIGHRTIRKDEELISSLKQTIIDLIDKGATTFLFGSMSEFDDLCWEIVTTLKTKIFHKKLQKTVSESFTNGEKSDII